MEHLITKLTFKSNKKITGSELCIFNIQITFTSTKAAIKAAINS